MGGKTPADRAGVGKGRTGRGRARVSLGDEFDKEKCNSAVAGIKHTTPVTLYPNGVSPYGCYDMAGNVWEWCADRYDAEAEDSRVLRGSSWFHSPGVLRVSKRHRGAAVDRSNEFGFRLVQDFL